MDAPKPGDFPIGSVESRAAMRLQLSNRRDDSARTVFISRIPRPWRGDGPEPTGWNKKTEISTPQPWGEGTVQILYDPLGVLEEEVQEMVENLSANTVERAAW